MHTRTYLQYLSRRSEQYGAQAVSRLYTPGHLRCVSRRWWNASEQTAAATGPEGAGALLALLQQDEETSEGREGELWPDGGRRKESEWRKKLT